MRKFWGIILIIFGWLLAVMTLLSAIPMLMRVINTVSFDSYGVGYLLGSFFFHFVFFFLSYWIIKKGIHLTKKKKIDDTIEKIESIK